MRTAAMLAIALAAVLAPARAARADAEGVYGPLEVRPSEASVMKTVTEYEEHFRRRGFLVQDQELEAFVQEVGARLAPKPVDPYIRYRFHVVRDPTVNAFALPDGQIYVHAGLLATVENEAQLAAVLGHEVSHTAGHHGLLTYRSNRAKQVSSMALGPFTLGLADIFLVLSIYGYSRDLESEADVHGAAAMLAAGYDPREAARFFDLLRLDPEEEEPKRATAWSSHPDLAVRAERMRAESATLLENRDPATLRTDAAAYRSRVRGVTVAVMYGLLDADQPRTACALATRLVTEVPGNAAAHLAVGDTLRALGARPLASPPDTLTDKEKKANQKDRRKLTREEREQRRLATPEGQAIRRTNLENALTAYREALSLDPELAEASRGAGFALIQLDRLEEGGTALVRYLRARPEAADRPIILKLLRAVTTNLEAGAEATP